MIVDRAIESALKRDRYIVLGALAVVVGVAWAYLLGGAGMEMPASGTTGRTAANGGAAMTTLAVRDFRHVALMFFMWWVMMAAMMLPSAAPVILLFAALNRERRKSGGPFVPTSLFASAYLVAWAGFGAAAVAAQWSLERAALLSPMLASTSDVLGGTLLLAAGLYQLTPLKLACLRHCRSPLQFILNRWRGGAAGAFRMGLEHGGYCVGCCWFLMGLLFFAGVMNLFWIAGLAAFVLLEKTARGGHWIGRAAGVGLIAFGGAVLAGYRPW